MYNAPGYFQFSEGGVVFAFAVGGESDTGTVALASTQPEKITLTTTGSNTSPALDNLTCAAQLTGTSPSRVLHLSGCTGQFDPGLFATDPIALTEIADN